MTEVVSQHCPKCDRHLAESEWHPSQWGDAGKWCRQCLTNARYMAAYRRGAIRYPFKVIYFRRCECCAAQMFSQKAYGRFCSRTCKDDARNARSQAERQATKAAGPVRHCLHCGADMPALMRADAVYCSDACNSAAHNATRKASWKIGERQERVSRAYIIERDGSRCHVCRKVCRPGDIHLDHIVPLARGGTHEAANLAVACARCNLSRGARGESQLRMLG